MNETNINQYRSPLRSYLCSLHTLCHLPVIMFLMSSGSSWIIVNGSLCLYKAIFQHWMAGTEARRFYTGYENREVKYREEERTGYCVSIEFKEVTGQISRSVLTSSPPPRQMHRIEQWITENIFSCTWVVNQSFQLFGGKKSSIL